MIHRKLQSFQARSGSTLLGVGPMSKNCVDVSIALANRHRIPLMLIASRRQIECASKGSGYVEKWSTEQFVEYVRKNDEGGHIVLARDHGGPWQHPSESKMSLGQAMQSAKESYTVDIESGLQIIHVDPSIDPHGTPEITQLVDRVFELYSHCWNVAAKLGRDIAFEVGTEEQGVGLHGTEDFERLLSMITSGCEKRGLPPPLFVVSQTGTKVMERRNVGCFESFVQGDRKPEEMKELLKICRRAGVMMKEHNTDYLSDGALSVHPGIGIHAANVAPEFGVTETLAFLRLAESVKNPTLVERFIELAHGSGKWEKWMLPGNTADDREKAIICGHYVFATQEFHEMKSQLSFSLKSRKVDLDEQLRNSVAASIERYLVSFGLVTGVSARATA